METCVGFARPKFNPEQVRAAGKALVSPKSSEIEKEHAVVVINNWRSAHSCPLNTFQMQLRSRASRATKSSNIAQRLKRLPAIEAKLRRHGKYVFMDTMQDIGGCRAVVTSVADVYKIVDEYNKPTSSILELVKPYDYIKEPKRDGYRSYHLVYRYRSNRPNTKCFDGMLIEVQIRSKPQHLWAGAVETVDFVTQQALKSNIGTDDWKLFFRLMSAYIAKKEGCPPVPNTPSDESQLIAELSAISKSLDPVLLLGGVAAIADETVSTEARHYLLTLDPTARRVAVRGFSELRDAAAAYAAVEKKAKAQAVLVKSTDLAAIKRAYPSYFLDTKAFIALLHEALGVGTSA